MTTNSTEPTYSKWASLAIPLMVLVVAGALTVFSAEALPPVIDPTPRPPASPSTVTTLVSAPAAQWRRATSTAMAQTT